jgi:hypothetical protein
LPIAPPMPIAAAAVHHDRAATFHCDCRCRPTCVASNWAASALGGIVRCPSCHPSRHCCPIPHHDCFAIPLPIAPPLPIAAAAVTLNLATAIHPDCRCRPSHVTSPLKLNYLPMHAT